MSASRAEQCLARRDGGGPGVTDYQGGAVTVIQYITEVIHHSGISQCPIQSYKNDKNIIFLGWNRMLYKNIRNDWPECLVGSNYEIFSESTSLQSAGLHSNSNTP